MPYKIIGPSVYVGNFPDPEKVFKDVAKIKKEIAEYNAGNSTMVRLRIVHTKYYSKRDKLLKELIANNTDLKNGDVIITPRPDGTNIAYVYCSDNEPMLYELEEANQYTLCDDDGFLLSYDYGKDGFGDERSETNYVGCD